MRNPTSIAPITKQTSYKQIPHLPDTDIDVTKISNEKYNNQSSQLKNNTIE